MASSPRSVFDSVPPSMCVVFEEGYFDRRVSVVCGSWVVFIAERLTTGTNWDGSNGQELL